VSRLFNDPSALYLITQPAARGREDYFFNSPGIQACTPAPCPVTTTLSPSRNPLQAPRFANWSLGWEHNLPKAIYLKVELRWWRSRGHSDWLFFTARLEWRIRRRF